ncbi:MAG: hypothetical protein LBL72_06025 [Candidatus Accumulibacter sp.]|jgi:hypothetical protein|nr:hypothetical protein [Accumulibacter sp.]
MKFLFLLLCYSPVIFAFFVLLVQLIEKVRAKKWRRSKAVFAEEKRYLKQVASICESFVKGGAESAYQTILSLRGDRKAYSILVLPWLLDTILSKDKASRSDLESLEKFMEISRIKSSEIPYPQAERMLKSLIFSKIPDKQKEEITESPIFSEFSSETRRAKRLKQMEPVMREKPKKTEASRWVWTLVCWAISIILFSFGMSTKAIRY